MARRLTEWEKIERTYQDAQKRWYSTSKRTKKITWDEFNKACCDYVEGFFKLGIAENAAKAIRIFNLNK